MNMKDKEKLLEIKKNLNRKRPFFLRTCADKRLKLRGKSWRRPKGNQSAMRKRRIGKRRLVEIGYRGPADVRGLTREGKEIIMINSFADLQKIKSKEQIGMLSRTLGMKQRYQIVKKANESNISFVNVKNTKQFLTDIDNQLIARKKEKSERIKAKQEKPKEKAKQSKSVDNEAVWDKSKIKANQKPQTQPAQKTSNAAEYAKKVFEQSKAAQPKAEKAPASTNLAKGVNKQ